jgi:hypothetical protein
MKKMLLVLAAAVTVAASAGTQALAGSGGGLPVANPDAVIHGMTYAQWEGAYQVWLEEIPFAKNPIVDPGSPRNCERQPGGVVFAGALGADCHVPSGAKVAFGTFFWECSTAEGNGNTFRKLRRCAVDNFDHDFSKDMTHTTIWIDGVKLNHPRKWIFTTPGEIIDFPKNNIFGADPGPSKSVTKGTLYILKPLSDGTHTVHVHANDAVAGQFNVDWVFNVG